MALGPATLRFQDVATGTIFRQWVATAAANDTAAGASVVITIAQTTAGAAPPSAADTLELILQDESGTAIITFSLTAASASQTATFFFRAGGVSGGALRADVVEMNVRATKTTGGPTNTYDAQSDGTPNTPPTGFNSTGTARGFARGTCTATTVLSNVSLGGAQTSPAAYDESLFTRVTLSGAPFVSRQVHISVSGPSGGPLTSDPAGTGTTFDQTNSNVVDQRFPAGSTTAVATPSVTQISTMAGVTWTSLTSAGTSSLACDPRLTATHLFQIDNNTFSTPPSAGAAASTQRLASNSGFLATRITNARAAGINGVTKTTTLVPTNPGTTVTQTGDISATAGGQAGWSAAFMSWTSSLPGGTWTKTVDVTAPSDIDNDAYLIGATQTYTLLAVDPTVRVFIRVGSSDTNQEDHFTIGDTLQIQFALIDLTNAQFKTLDASPVPFALVLRYSAGVLQYWDGAVWQTASGTLTKHNMTATADARVFAINLAGLAADGADVIVVCSGNIDGSPYSDILPREVVGVHNQHDLYQLR